jgi:hypothetical protein
MNRNEKAKLILEEILDDITLSRLALSSILRKYLRATQLLDMPDDKAIIEKELNGYDGGDILPKYRILNCSKRYSWLDTLPYSVIRVPSWKEEFYKPMFQDYYLRDSVSRLEIYQSEGIHYNMGVHVLYGVNVTDLVDIKPQQISEVLETIKNRLYEDCSLLSINLELSNQSETIFQEKEIMVRTFLQKVSTKTLDKLDIATDTLKNGKKGTHWAQVSLACIESLINFANDIYQEEYLPKDEVKPSHTDFKRRIKFTLMSKITHKSRREYLEKLMDFIKGLDGYLQDKKHNPDEADRYDARRCLIYTYLLMSDVIESLLEHEGGES